LIVLSGITIGKLSIPISGGVKIELRNHLKLKLWMSSIILDTIPEPLRDRMEIIDISNDDLNCRLFFLDAIPETPRDRIKIITGNICNDDF
jgi:hypothetical protein